MKHFKIITEPQEWADTIRRFSNWDFFHSHRYHLSRLESPLSSPWMLALFDGEEVDFALPMVRRELDDGLFDLVSVYGYSGPLSRDVGDLTPQMENVNRELKSLGCVSLFCRLHPVLHELVMPNDIVFDAGKTVAIPCGQEDERFAGYRKTTRYEIQKLIRLGAKVTFDDSEDSFVAFTDIYRETMKALDADPFYFFDDDFLKSLFKIPDVKTVIGLVRYEGEIISSGLFTAVNGIAQYFLGGARVAHQKLAPQKLLLHRATDWAQQQNAKLLHLGGGRGAQEDSLFRFKAGFSQRVLPFRLMKIIFDQHVYDRLNIRHAKSLNIDMDALSSSSYFPLYRATL